MRERQDHISWCLDDLELWPDKRVGQPEDPWGVDDVQGVDDLTERR